MPACLHGCHPILYASFAHVVSHHRKALKLDEVQFQRVNDARDAVARKLNVVNVWEEDVSHRPGQTFRASWPATPSKASKRPHRTSPAARVDVLVTAPIDKHAMQQAGFAYPGHTEFLQHMAGGESEVLMLLVADGLRVGTVTGHIPIKDVAARRSPPIRIIAKARLLHQSLLRDFGIVARNRASPSWASTRTPVMAAPSAARTRSASHPPCGSLNDEGITAMGPYAADGFFGNGSYKHFDGVLAMYHDQGLAPFKALSFGNGVNFTAGLPIVRTSPDHGTGLDIAGQGVANEASFRAAIWMACDIHRNRERYKTIGANPLQPQKREKERKEG
jgi:4-hydroxythreonine-4-phosphate dehydrogenase